MMHHKDLIHLLWKNHYINIMIKINNNVDIICLSYFIFKKTYLIITELMSLLKKQYSNRYSNDNKDKGKGKSKTSRT